VNKTETKLPWEEPIGAPWIEHLKGSSALLHDRKLYTVDAQKAQKNGMSYNVNSSSYSLKLAGHLSDLYGAWFREIDPVIRKRRLELQNAEMQKRKLEPVIDSSDDIFCFVVKELLHKKFRVAYEGMFGLNPEFDKTEELSENDFLKEAVPCGSMFFAKSMVFKLEPGEGNEYFDLDGNQLVAKYWTSFETYQKNHEAGVRRIIENSLAKSATVVASAYDAAKARMEKEKVAELKERLKGGVRFSGVEDIWIRAITADDKSKCAYAQDGFFVYKKIEPFWLTGTNGIQYKFPECDLGVFVTKALISSPNIDITSVQPIVPQKYRHPGITSASQMSREYGDVCLTPLRSAYSGENDTASKIYYMITSAPHNFVAGVADSTPRSRPTDLYYQPGSGTKNRQISPTEIEEVME